MAASDRDERSEDCDHGSLISRWVWGALRLPITAILYGKAGRFHRRRGEAGEIDSKSKPLSPAF